MSLENFFEFIRDSRRLLFTWAIAPCFYKFGKGSKIEPPFRRHNLRFVSLGNRVSINRDCWLVVTSLEHRGSRSVLTIGSDTGIGMGATISAASSVTIGEHVLLARNVYISDHGHAFEDVARPIMFQGITEPRPVSIGDRTWLGQNVCVLPGVSIGRHCVIGANSVVVSDVPDFSVAVGAPARVVKRYDPSDRCWKRVASRPE